MFRILIAFLLMSTAAQAEKPLSPEEFDSLTLGKTFTYGTNAIPYGAEEYLPNRRVRWSFLDGRCMDGEWYVEEQHICFIYEDDPDPHCWEFFLRGGSLAARLRGEPSSEPLYEVERDSKPLYCMGPDIGV